MKKVFKYLKAIYQVWKIRKTIKGKRASIEEVVKEKFNFIGSTKPKHRGLKLYAYDVITEVIELVPIIDQTGTGGGKRGFLNPEHELTWAINKKNAKRKFKKARNEIEVVE